MDSEGWILAQATAGSRSGSARFVGSDCGTTESPGAAAAAAKHRCKFGVAVVLRRRRAVVCRLSSRVTQSKRETAILSLAFKCGHGEPHLSEGGVALSVERHRASAANNNYRRAQNPIFTGKI